MPEIVIIAALAESNGAIGHQGKLPWSLPEDLVRFRQLTLNHTVIMGRKTWEFDLEKRPLKLRSNIIVSSQLASQLMNSSDVWFARSIHQALDRARTAEKVFIIGGATVYTQTIDLADTLELTWVEGNYPGDVFFPVGRDWILERFELAIVEQRTGFRFETFRRK